MSFAKAVYAFLSPRPQVRERSLVVCFSELVAKSLKRMSQLGWSGCLLTIYNVLSTISLYATTAESIHAIQQHHLYSCHHFFWVSIPSSLLLGLSNRFLNVALILPNQ